MRLKQLENYIKNILIIKKYRDKRNSTVKSKSNIPIDHSHLSREILNLIKKVDTDIYPMFGTLLSIYRDKAFNFADDFDFATHDRSIFNLSLVDKMESLGANLVSLSTIKDNTELIELSFKYKNATIDIFYIENVENISIHRCPNFRVPKEKPVKQFHNGLKFKTFESHFEVVYPKIELTYNSDFNIYIPSNPRSIFDIHYGIDWETPKRSNFIDFKKYNFIDKKSATIYGSSKNLRKLASKLI